MIIIIRKTKMKKIIFYGRTTNFIKYNLMCLDNVNTVNNNFKVVLVGTDSEITLISQGVDYFNSALNYGGNISVMCTSLKVNW